MLLLTGHSHNCSPGHVMTSVASVRAGGQAGGISDNRSTGRLVLMKIKHFFVVLLSLGCCHRQELLHVSKFSSCG